MKRMLILDFLFVMLVPLVARAVVAATTLIPGVGGIYAFMN